jgi:hypothetical protein
MLTLTYVVISTIKKTFIRLDIIPIPNSDIQVIEEKLALFLENPKCPLYFRMKASSLPYMCRHPKRITGMSKINIPTIELLLSLFHPPIISNFNSEY